MKPKGKYGRNKADLVDFVAKTFDLSKADAKIRVDSVLYAIAYILLADRTRLTLSGFGTFSVQQRKPFATIVPATGEEIVVEARESVTFRQSGQLRKLLNRKKAPTRKVRR